MIFANHRRVFLLFLKAGSEPTFFCARVVAPDGCKICVVARLFLPPSKSQVFSFSGEPYLCALLMQSLALRIKFAENASVFSEVCSLMLFMPLGSPFWRLTLTRIGWSFVSFCASSNARRRALESAR